MTDADLTEYERVFAGCADPWVRGAVARLVAEVRKGRAELVTVRARWADAILRDPGEENAHEPSGDPLLDRLRGIYTTPVNDGAGPLNGSYTFTRKFPTLPINVEAAAEIERLRAELAEQKAATLAVAERLRAAAECLGRAAERKGTQPREG